MSTPTIEQIYHHRSIRAYKSDPIPTSMIEEIVAAGQRASTSSNLQMFSVVVVRDQQKRNQLATYCGDQAHIRQAPVFIAWCADLNRLSRVCALRGHDHVALLIGVDSVVLVEAGVSGDAIEQEGHQRDVELQRQPRIHALERRHVVWAEVRRQSHPGERHFDAHRLKTLDDRAEV